jgi:hypothetical protein
MVQADVNDVKHSLTRKISCLSRFKTSAAKETPTASGGYVVLCVSNSLGTFSIEAQWWQLDDTSEIALSKSNAKKNLRTTAFSWFAVGCCS